MSFSPQELSSFFIHYSTIGDTVQIDAHLIEEHSLVGHGELYFPTRTLEFTVHVVDNKELTESICMTEVDDFGLFEILIHKDYPGQNFLPDYRALLEVACLRQLVRFGIEEMPTIYKDISHTTLGLGQLYKDYPAVLDYQPEVQTFFLSRIDETRTHSPTASYLNAAATSLLHGGVNIREYEVDLETLRFVSRHQLINLHYASMGYTNNNVIMFELQNRINRLLISEYNGNVIHPEFELRLYLN